MRQTRRDLAELKRRGVTMTQVEEHKCERACIASAGNVRRSAPPTVAHKRGTSYRKRKQYGRIIICDHTWVKP
jgi:hypothetical protein